MSKKSVNIIPGVSVLGVFKHLNYQSWYALAEFVDNSVESFLLNKGRLSKDASKATVNIDIETMQPARITIRDNAAGISLSDFPRAFRPASIPPDRTGLAEFGMGMKSAACWFAPNWTVRTSAIGDPFTRTVKFDIQNIVKDDITELEIVEIPSAADDHFTEVILDNIHYTPVGRTLAKIKDHLTDIYRVFVREGVLELKLNGKSLEYKAPKILKAPHYQTPDGPAQVWKKDISFDLGEGISVYGFAAIREKGATSKAGFALLRRGRIIEGSGDEGYRPKLIFGSSNSYRYQRLFGELHLDGFDVSHTKDGFRWDENEQPFLELLKEHLDEKSLPLLKQAEGYRVRKPAGELKKGAEKAVEGASTALEIGLPEIMPTLSDAPQVSTPDTEPPPQETLAKRKFSFPFRNQMWEIEVELTNDPAIGDWYSISDNGQNNERNRRVDIRVSMAHPFMVKFAQNDSDHLDGYLRIAAALGIAEVIARSSGVRSAGTVRRNLNEILSTALSGH